MNRSDVTSVTITVDVALSVSGLLWAPAGARACYVLAHGAGTGMSHPFMDVVARELAERGIATLRYQFPYMEQRARRPAPPNLRMRPFGPPWPQPRSLRRHLRWSPAASPSAAV
jgi:uncharacterized protein